MVCKEGEFLLLADESSDQSDEDSDKAMSDVESAEPRDSVSRFRWHSWLRFDIDASDIKSLKCAIAGKGNWGSNNCYVIVVKPRSDGDGVFERVGIGSIESKYISLDGPVLKAIIT
jgi:hypothetical protein